MNNLTIKPRLLPRGPADMLLGVSVGVLQAAFLFYGPAILVGYLFRSFWVGLVVFIVIFTAWILLSVTKLHLSAEGVRFVRLLGSPKFLAWNEIQSIEPAPPRELVLKGWLWPLFPAREMTFCLSAMGHYRFRYGDRYTYFPPADESAFRGLIAKHLPHAA